jgi:phosphopantetheinyl transferase
VSVLRLPDGLKAGPLTLDGATVALRRLDDIANGSDLSEGEQALVVAAKSPSRRQELRAGRAAAHAAFRAAGALPPQEVLKSLDGRPMMARSRGWYLSLAHDGDLAVAACDTLPVGVDLAPFRREAQLERVVRSAIGAELARPLEGHVTWPVPLVLWTAWEAFGKQRGVGVLGEAMRGRIHVGMDGESATAVLGQSRLRWWTDDENVFCLATTLPSPE